jgi:hypothetical protein
MAINTGTGMDETQDMEMDKDMDMDTDMDKDTDVESVHVHVRPCPCSCLCPCLCMNFAIIFSTDATFNGLFFALSTDSFQCLTCRVSTFNAFCPKNLRNT